MKFRCLLWLAAAGMCLAADNNSVIVDQIVARVNGDIVSQDELKRTGREMLQAMRQQGVPETRIEEELRRQENDLLRNRIDELLLT